MLKRSKSEARRSLLLCLFVLGLVTAIIVVPYQYGTKAAGKKGGGLINRTVSQDEVIPKMWDIREERGDEYLDALARFRQSAGRTAAAVADIRDGFVRGEAAFKQSHPTAKVEYNLDIRIPEVLTPDVHRSTIEWLTAPSAARRPDILRNFLKRNQELIGVDQSQINSLKTTADYTNPDGNLSYVRLEQEINGIPVFRGEVNAGFTKSGELIRVINNLAPAVDYDRVSDNFGDPLAAVKSAAEHINHELRASDVTRNNTESTDLKVVFGGGDWATTAEKMYFPTEPGVAVPAWRILFWRPVNAYYVIVDAGSGTALWHKNISDDQTQAATYDVYTNSNAYVNASDSVAPMSPYISVPPNDPTVGVQGALITRNSVTRVGNEAPYIFNNNGWITDGANITDGNSNEAGIDRDGTNGVDAPQTGAPNRVFSSTWNPPPGAPPPGDEPLTAQAQRGAVIQMFYLMNLYHDELYLRGFNEQARNFQGDNFGRGGVANDRVSSEGQDSSGTNNANFGTPADGGRGRMQMFLWTGATPDRDGTADADIVFHEVTHGTSNRLHGNGSGLGNQGGMMGEGWGDFYGATMLAQPTDDINGVYGLGGYSLINLTAGFTSNYFYGIRRFPTALISTTGGPNRPACNNGPCPYNPLTFKHINTGCDTTLGTTTTAVTSAFPRNPAIATSGSCSQVHNAGEIWKSALWEVRALLIAHRGFASGTTTVLQIVTDGMKLSPINPDMLQERDAIIIAAAALPRSPATSGDADDVREGFRRRGMGRLASVQSATAVTESFDTWAPDFAVTVTPGSRAICAGTSAVYTVNTEALMNFTDPITLSATGQPAGTTVTFSPNPVTPGSSSTMTVSNTGAAASGAYTINVVGTSGALTHNQNVTLNVSNGISAAPSLTAPANAAVGVPTTPNFTWAASAGAATYDIQVATDAAFLNIVASATGLTVTNWTSSVNLGTNTQYFWRVRSANPCGNGNFSSPFSFTTACIVTASYSGPPVAIPDNIPAGVNINLPVTGVGTVTDLDFRFDTAGACDATVGNPNAAMDHTFIGDLTFKLTSPGGTSVTFQARRGGTRENICLTTLDDDGGFPNISTLTAVTGSPESGNFSPETTGQFSGFDGQNGDGTWVLNVSDNAGVDTGSMRRFSLLLSGSSTCGAGGTPTATSTGTPAATATSTSTVAATATATSTPTATASGTPGCGTTVSYTGPAVSIPDNTAAGVNITVPVSGVGTVSDLNFTFDGIQSADPASTTPGISHSWVGDIIVKITSPGGTTVTAYDRPGVPTTTVGCSNNNLAQIVLDDDGGFPAVEAQCNTTGTTTNNAFPTGSFSPNNALSAFDGQNANGNWVINISDNAAADTGSARAFSLVFGGGACGTPTSTSTGTPAATATSTSTVANTATATSTATVAATCTPSGGQVVLFDQTSSAGTNGTSSQDFETANDTFDNRDADDFVVPAGQTWTVQKVAASGLYFNGAGPVDTFNVTFYTNAGTIPGSAVAGGTFTGATYTNAAGVFTITLPSSVTLPAGTYWVSVQARMDFTPGGQWAWLDRTVTSGSPAAWQNPGGGFGVPACTSWAARGSVCGIDAAAPDQIFQIIGTTGGGGCASPTATFTGTPVATSTSTSTSTATATATATSTSTPGSGCNQNFDGVTAPALPAGWTSAATGAEVAWVTSATGSDTAPNNAFAPDPAAVGNTELISPTIAISAGGGAFSFRNNFNTENTFDGMVLEISIDGGAFQDIVTAGGSFVTGGYTGLISSNFNSPIAGRQAWTGNSAGYITSTVNLPAAAGGHNIQLKWRMATDSSVAATGVSVDTITGLPCFTGTPTATSTGTPPPTSTNTATATNTATPTASPSCTPSSSLVPDGTFEAGTPWPLWTVQTSTNFGSPNCNTALCGTGGGTAPPFAGDNWAWFGGAGGVAETATLGQNVVIPAGGNASLTFQMRIGSVLTPFSDTLVVTVDGTQVASFTEPATAETAYTLRTVNVSAFANGASHAILFTYTSPDGSSNFTVDDVSLASGCGPIGTPTATSTGTPASTATATATPTSTGTPGCGTTVSYTGPAVSIPDNTAAGVNITVPVSGVGTVSDLNFTFDGIQSADPASTTPGISHSWVGDIIVKITSPGGTTVTAYDRPGVPTTTVGCSNNNLAQIVLDDDGGFPAVEAQCNTTGTTTNNAFPTGSFSPNNALSAFDGQNANGNWVINISDNAAADTGSARAFSLVFGGPCGSPSATPTSTATSTPTGTPSGTTVQFGSATYTEDESQTAAITVNRTGNTTGTTTVDFATSNGTATGGAACTSGVDYISVAQTVTFNAGDTTKTVNVTVCSDTLTEPVQTVNLTLSAPVGGTIGSPNPALLNINDSASAYRSTAAVCTTFGQPASPYPSTIAVAGGPSSIGSIRVTLYDMTATIPDSMDFLLVGPGGQKFILMADAGGTLDLTNPVTLTFSDVAGQVLPNSAPLTTGLFEPTSWEAGQTSFPAPAPAAPYNEPGSTVGGTATQTLLGNFGATNGNGTWSLYMRDDAGALTNAITGCLNGGWGLELFASTAANAAVSGRVMTADGRGIRNAKVTITGNTLTEPIVATTGSFGYFTFEGLQTGQTYVVTVNSQRYTFQAPSRVISLVDNIADMDFIADQ